LIVGNILEPVVYQTDGKVLIIHPCQGDSMGFIVELYMGIFEMACLAIHAKMGAMGCPFPVK
jgi:hypothetical protein